MYAPDGQRRDSNYAQVSCVVTDVGKHLVESRNGSVIL